jgi:hypothetical protein
MITTAIEAAVELAKGRGWDKTYWAFDLHGTILVPNYKKGDIPTEFYPNALEALKMISSIPEICMIMYTCSHPHEIEEYLEFFKKHNIIFHFVNENPEVPDAAYGYYRDKFYFNVLFEDKAGFLPKRDWTLVKSKVFDLYKS